MATIDFKDWVERELDRLGWKQADLARAAGMDTGYLSKILSGASNAGPESCVAIARALNYPPDLVFRKAGILPDGPRETSTSNELVFLFDQLDDEDQQTLLIMVRAIVREKVRRFGRAATPQET